MLGQEETQVSGLLGAPLPHWIGGDAREVDLPSVDLDGAITRVDANQAGFRASFQLSTSTSSM